MLQKDQKSKKEPLYSKMTPFDIEKSKENIQQMKKNLQQLQTKYSNDLISLKEKNKKLEDSYKSRFLEKNSLKPTFLPKEEKKNPLNKSTEESKTTDNEIINSNIKEPGMKKGQISTVVNSQVIFNIEKAGELTPIKYDALRMKIKEKEREKTYQKEDKSKSGIAENDSLNKNTQAKVFTRENFSPIKKKNFNEIKPKDIFDDGEFFRVEDSDKKKLELNKDEKITYGTREPQGYKKVSLLGKGGSGFVFSGLDSNGKVFAIKQVAKKNAKTENSMVLIRNEINMMKFISHNINSDLLNTVITLIDYLEDQNDMWMIFEKSGSTLSSYVFKLKGEFLKNERIYCAQKGIFLKTMLKDLSIFKQLLRKILKILCFFSDNGIVHCDLKPDNILVEFEYNENKEKITNIKSFKLIDFGSSFFINSAENFSSNTPEYLCPEINELMEKGNSNSKLTAFIKSMNPWSIDIWSLGVMILEIVLCCPLWMSYKTKIIRNEKVIYTTGLFGVKGRSGEKIYQKQVEVANSIPEIMKDCIIKNEEERNLLIDLVSKMLNPNEKMRISPNECLNHPFLL